MKFSSIEKRCILLFSFIMTGTGIAETNNAQNVTTDNLPPKNKIETVIGYVEQYCGTCHKVPSPTLMPKKDWSPAIDAMVVIADKRLKKDFIPESVVKDIKAYYRGSSPEKLPRLPIHKNTQQKITFPMTNIAKKSEAPNVININSVELGISTGAEFLICDGDTNQVILLSHNKGNWQETVLANIKAPSHTQIIDFDGDGDNDIIVAALGQLPPSDALSGKVFLLRQSDKGVFEKELLLSGVGRVTDARVVDIDNDADLDLLVAVFGGGDVGELMWFENIGNGAPIIHSLIQTSGALNISPVDLNADGKLDIVSVITQEHEMIVAMINQGKGQFKAVSLIQAPHPMFGFTGMKLVDLDSDSDMDILFTNGDAHDLQRDPKPYHGIQWLENQGDLNFKYHDIARFYGAVAAVAGDMDNDGDLDVVASSWNNYWDDPQRQSLIWFENDGKQNFARHNITAKPQSIVTFALKDINGNGALDIVAGVLRMDLLIKKMFASSDNTDDKNTNDKNTDNISAETKPKKDLIQHELLETRIIMLENIVATNQSEN